MRGGGWVWSGEVVVRRGEVVVRRGEALRGDAMLGGEIIRGGEVMAMWCGEDSGGGETGMRSRRALRSFRVESSSSMVPLIRRRCSWTKASFSCCC